MIRDCIGLLQDADSRSAAFAKYCKGLHQFKAAYSLESWDQIGLLLGRNPQKTILCYIREVKFLVEKMYLHEKNTKDLSS
jgi:hypothetical protein